MKCVTCKVDLDQHGTRDFETCLQKASVPRSVISVQARKAVADALELAKARRILLTIALYMTQRYMSSFLPTVAP